MARCSTSGRRSRRSSNDGRQLVLSGHDHDYERSIPWRQFVATGSAITYVVTGGGGGALNAVGTSSWTAKSASVYHYMRMTAGGCVMTVEAVGLDGAVFDQTSINRCAAANQPPQVTLMPAGGTSYPASSDVSISATATDDGSIARVEFYAGTTLLKLNVRALRLYLVERSGRLNDIRAIAYDNQGASATSAAAIVSVTAASPPPTGVAFRASTDHATMVTRYELRSTGGRRSQHGHRACDLGSWKAGAGCVRPNTVDRSASSAAWRSATMWPRSPRSGSGGSSRARALCLRVDPAMLLQLSGPRTSARPAGRLRSNRRRHRPPQSRPVLASRHL